MRLTTSTHRKLTTLQKQDGIHVNLSHIYGKLLLLIIIVNKLIYLSMY